MIALTRTSSGLVIYPAVGGREGDELDGRGDPFPNADVRCEMGIGPVKTTS